MSMFDVTFWNPCLLHGHAYAHVGTTVDGRQVHVCPRCGTQWEQWMSNGTDTPPSPARPSVRVVGRQRPIPPCAPAPVAVRASGPCGRLQPS